MGSLISWFQSAFANIKAQILLLGLDAAGKTTILLKLKLGDAQEGGTVPTIGFNVEEVKYRNVTFSMWDVGGQEKLRKLWTHYYDGANALIFVIDSNDRDRMGIAKEELHRLLKEPTLQGATLLVLCNKQDLPHRLTPSQIVDILELKTNHELTRGRKWFAQGCCATSGEGLYEGLDWLSSNVKATPPPSQYS